jgi:hypothetical protein
MLIQLWQFIDKNLTGRYMLAGLDGRKNEGKYSKATS